MTGQGRTNEYTALRAKYRQRVIISALTWLGLGVVFVAAGLARLAWPISLATLVVAAVTIFLFWWSLFDFLEADEFVAERSLGPCASAGCTDEAYWSASSSQWLHKKTQSPRCVHVSALGVVAAGTVLRAATS
jgi:hypothetical protein